MFGKLGFSILGVDLCLCVGCVTNPITGKEELMLIPVDRDVEIGRKFLKQASLGVGLAASGKLPATTASRGVASS